MAIWKEQQSPRTDAPASLGDAPRADDVSISPFANPTSTQMRTTTGTMKESIIAAELTIEGKVEGTGHIRMAGKFKGDVNVDGNLTIEPGAKVTGSVRARTVTIGGELEGNIDSASHVELQETGVLNGDLRAGSFVVASGSRMRGQVAFGWDDINANTRTTTTTTSSKKSEKLDRAEAVANS